MSFMDGAVKLQSVIFTKGRNIGRGGMVKNSFVADRDGVTLAIRPDCSVVVIEGDRVLIVPQSQVDTAVTTLDSLTEPDDSPAPAAAGAVAAKGRR